jgi:hypothetical protein
MTSLDTDKLIITFDWVLPQCYVKTKSISCEHSISKGESKVGWSRLPVAEAEGMMMHTETKRPGDFWNRVIHKWRSTYTCHGDTMFKCLNLTSKLWWNNFQVSKTVYEIGLR